MRDVVKKYIDEEDFYQLHLKNGLNSKGNLFDDK